MFLGGLLLWSLVAPMSSAVIAPAQFVVDNNVKKIQHPTGGVVGQILVREGDRVAEGDLLLRLDETVTRANLQVIVRQLDELAGRKARLEAERDGRDTLEPPAELTARGADPEVGRIIAAEQRLFQARRAARESQRAQLERRIAQLRSEILGLQSQQEANVRETRIIAEELNGVRDLFKKQLTPIMRLNGLERQAVNLDGQKGQLAASIAQSEGKIAEIELQIMQIEENLRAETQRELREIHGKTAELSERRVAAEDQLRRVEMRSPSAGFVHQLGTHTVGGVISPAEPVMLIVPVKDELVLEARVAPQDRDQLAVGQAAVVRVTTSGQRGTPQLNGTLTRIAADVSKDGGSTAPFYSVRITIPADELARLRTAGISAGMQADVFIEAGSRSLLQYLLRPLSDQTARAFRER
jgi:HlyD family secretion protein